MVTDDVPHVEPAVNTRPRLTIWIVISASLFSFAIAVFVAWLVVVRPAEARRPAAIPVDHFLAGSANVSGAGAGSSLDIGASLPQIGLERLDGTATTTFDELRGSTPVVINFWSSTCTPCLREMPMFEKAHAQHAGTVTFIGIDTAESADAGRAMARKTGVSYPQLRDPGGGLVVQFGGTVLPHTVVVAADGTIREFHQGAYTSATQLDDSIRAAIAPR